MRNRRHIVAMTCLATLLSALVGAGADERAITLRARSFRPGEVMVVGITAPDASGTAEVRVFDRVVPAHGIGEGRWRALVGIDLDQAPGEYVVEADLGGTRITRRLSVLPKPFPTRRLRVNPDFVNPPAELMARIEKEGELMAAAFADAADEPLWSTPFLRPVPHPANSRFGTRSVFNGEPRNAHAGTDFLSPAGTPVRAPNAGRVLVARDLYFAGGSVLIDHGAGVFSQMAHLSRIDVAEGAEVKRGQVVGRVGATGRVTGPHLHWAVRVNGARVDGLSLLATLGAPRGK